VGKKKLRRFVEMETFKHVFQPPFNEILKKNFKFKGKWNENYFQNNNPIILELGCGKGEYTVGLAKKYSNINFIGVDIKGARMWKGAVDALKCNLQNVAFLRTRIELINSFFSTNEINEIWITFPDPQLKKAHIKKRLTSSRFLNFYKLFLTPGGTIHLKTDNPKLFEYTLDLINDNHLKLVYSTKDLYNSNFVDDALSIKTFYEKHFLNEGENIYYLKFKLTNNLAVKEPNDREK